MNAFDWYLHTKSYVDEFGKQNVFVSSYDALKLQNKNAILDSFMQKVGVEKYEIADEWSMNLKNSGIKGLRLELMRVCNPVFQHDDQIILRELVQQHLPKNYSEHYSCY